MLSKPKGDFQPVTFIFLIDVLDEGLEVRNGFINRGGCLPFLSHTGNIIACRQV